MAEDSVGSVLSLRWGLNCVDSASGDENVAYGARTLADQRVMRDGFGPFTPRRFGNVPTGEGE